MWLSGWSLFNTTITEAQRVFSLTSTIYLLVASAQLLFNKGLIDGVLLRCFSSFVQGLLEFVLIDSWVLDHLSYQWVSPPITQFCSMVTYRKNQGGHFCWKSLQMLLFIPLHSSLHQQVFDLLNSVSLFELVCHS